MTKMLTKIEIIELEVIPKFLRLMDMCSRNCLQLSYIFFFLIIIVLIFYRHQKKLKIYAILLFSVIFGSTEKKNITKNPYLTRQSIKFKMKIKIE